MNKLVFYYYNPNRMCGTGNYLVQSFYDNVAFEQPLGILKRTSREANSILQASMRRGARMSDKVNVSELL